MRVLICTAALSVSLVSAGAQTPNASGASAQQIRSDGGQNTTAVEQQIIKLEQDAIAATRKRDIAFFDRLLADDAMIVMPHGVVDTKAGTLASLKAGDFVLESSEINDMKVRVFGDTAIATYGTTDKATYKGQDVSGRYRYIDVFARRGGTWQLVASQGTIVLPPQQPPKQ